MASTAFTSITRSSSSSSTPRPLSIGLNSASQESPPPLEPQAMASASAVSVSASVTSMTSTAASAASNPYRRIFEQRQQFYESISGLQSETSSIKSGWQLRPPRPIMRPQSNKDVFTVRTNIEPFGPFVIEHDVKSQVPKLQKNSKMICLNPQDSESLRYATSHSEDGVESHLEVSLGRDGSIIKTRHSRADQEENSILKLQYGEGGKVLEIQQKQSLVVPRVLPSGPRSGPRPNSAYCTTTYSPGYFVPRYNSMPNLEDGRRRFPNELGFQTHPRDEEKIDAYTRGTYNV